MALAVLRCLRYRLTRRGLAEMFTFEGIVFSHEAVRDREAGLASARPDEIRQRRRGRDDNAVSSPKPGCPGRVGGSRQHVAALTGRISAPAGSRVRWRCR